MKEGPRNGETLCEGIHEGGLGGGLLQWGTQRYVKQGSEIDVCFRRSPVLGNMDGRFFLGAFLLEEFYKVFERYTKCPLDEYLSP